MKNTNATRAVRVALFVTALLIFCRGFFAGVALPKNAEVLNPEVLFATSADKSKIRELLAEQAGAWNRGDIDSFMTSYWKSDETLFVGSTGVARGWQAVLDRYHRAYPDRRAMGHLTFSNLEVHAYCSDAALALGNYHLDRENDRPEGIFTLDLRKFPEGWRIVVDHTTAFPPAKPLQSH